MRSPQVLGRSLLIVASLASSALAQSELPLFPAAQYRVGKDPYAMVLADLNGDGLLDAVTANNDGHTVSVILGDGEGGFGGDKKFAAGLHPVSIASGELNGDGKLDVVTANEYSSEISVLLGNGQGNFEPPMDFTVGTTAPRSVALGDLNGDGNLVP
jgi:hypothetical protein